MQQTIPGVIGPSREIHSGSALKKQAAEANEYLTRVVDEHPDTPWAMLASRELASPLGWQWSEVFTNVNPPPQRTQPQNDTVRTPRDRYGAEDRAKANASPAATLGR